MGRINPTIPDRIGEIISHPDWLRQFDRHAREVLNETGSLPNTPIWDYLHHRRDLAPSRFDHHHPFWRKLFRDEGRHHPTLPVAPVQPPTSPVIIQPPPLPGMVPAVPEPASGVTWGLCMAFVLAYWFMRRGGR